MAIVCDVNIIRGTGAEELTQNEEIVIPDIAIVELLTSESWGHENKSRIISAIKKVKHFLDSGKVRILKPADIYLTRIGITSIPPLLSQMVLNDLFSDILEADGSIENEKAIQLLQRIRGYFDYEIEFPEVIADFLKDLNTIKNKLLKRKYKFHELSQSNQREFMTFAKFFWNETIKNFLKITHKVDPDRYLFNAKESNDNNLIHKVYAAYFYKKFDQLGSVNDQYDLQYPIYLNQNDRIWTNDRLIKLILIDELNLPELIYTPPNND